MVLILVLAAFILSLIPHYLAYRIGKDRIHTLESVDQHRVALVFGAGLQRDSTPSPVLADRVHTAADLYRAGKVEKILMSGDNRYLDYNEPGAMKEYAAGLGIPAVDIILDYAGRRTYDSCYRARHIFQVQSAILVTQKFHLPRALYICNKLGLSADGVPADRRDYYAPDHAYWVLREYPATLVAWIQVHITRPEPVLGDPEPIFPEG